MDQEREWDDPWDERAAKRRLVQDYRVVSTAEVLRKDGIVVFDPAIDLQQEHSAFLDYLATMPEVLPEWSPSGDVFGRRVAGGAFGAFAHSSSFHVPFVRRLRTQLHTAFRPVAALLEPGRQLESLVDRLLYRPTGDAPAGEQVHRDHAKGLAPRDICFGGVLNLNLHESQYLSVQKGTHLWRSLANGQNYTPESKEAVTEFKREREDVEIPPGCFAVMDETLRHEVRGKKCKVDLLRLFHGFRITDETGPLYPENDRGLASQGILQYKGGALPRMVPRLYAVNWLDKWRDYSARFVPGMLHTHTQGDGSQHPGMVKHYCPSLEFLGAMYPPYSDAEVAILRPAPY